MDNQNSTSGPPWGQPPAPSSEPVMAGTVRRITNLTERLSGFQKSLARIANRLQLGEEEMPSPPEPSLPVTGRAVYGGGLSDQFLEQHDKLETLLEQLDSDLARIRAII